MNELQQQSAYYEVHSRMLIRIGQQEYPVEQGILILILIISLIFNTFLFARGNGTYSIKYQLMKKHKFWRINQKMTYLIQYLYKAFFMLPFLLIVAIAVLRAIVSPLQLFPILINGLIVILIIYPSQRQLYYLKNLFIWAFALGSQFVTLFLEDVGKTQVFMEVSAMFYTLNAMVFALALMANQKTYWEIGDAVEVLGFDKIQEINRDWIKHDTSNLPKIFDGGLYGWMSKNQSSSSLFMTLYFFSLIILGVYAFIIYQLQNSYLGITGLITSIIYDIFILTFSSLHTKQRSVTTLFIMIYIGRLLTFIFGKQYWLFGYGVLYFFVGIFIGNIIIDRHWPLKFTKVSDKRQKINALKTPQFVLFILTIQIIILILVQQVTQITSQQSISVSSLKSIPIWQFCIILFLLTWIVIMYMLTIRLMTRHLNKIRQMIQYFFGYVKITQYHLYLVITYLLIVSGGLYCLLYLGNRDIFLGTVFLPLIYGVVFQIGAAWVKNDYNVLADTTDFNRRQFRKYQNKNKKLQVLKSRKLKEIQTKKIKMLQYQNNIGQNNLTSTNNNFGITNSRFNNELSLLKSDTRFFQYSKNRKSKKLLQKNKNTDQIQQGSQSQVSQKKLMQVYSSSPIRLPPISRPPLPQLEQLSTNQFYSSPPIDMKAFKIDQNQKEEMQETREGLDDFVELKNWRVIKDMTYTQIWSNFTYEDKSILIFATIGIIQLTVYSIVAGVWADSISGIAFTVSIISFLTSFVYYKAAKSPSSQHPIGQILIAIGGFLMGLIFWAVQYQIIYGAIIYSIVQIALYLLNLQTGIKKKIQNYFIIILAIKIVILLLFICVILGVNYSIVVGIICLAVIIACGIGCVNFYYLHVYSHIPILVEIISGVILIGMVASAALVGFLLDFISDFTVFTIVMAFVIVGFLIISIIISLTKYNNRLVNPHVYSPYGFPIYRFESDKQKLKSSSNHVIVFQVAMILLVAYSAVVVLFFDQKYFSIHSLSIFLIVQFTQLILRSIETSYFFGQCKHQITKKIIEEAFFKVKQKYMPNEVDGDDSPFYIEKWKQAKLNAAQTKITDEQELDKKYQLVVEYKQQVYKNLQEQQKFLFFWLALIRLHIYGDRINKKVQYITMFEEIKEQLNEFGIIIESIQSSESVEIKYQLVEKEVNSLQPVDYIIVQECCQKRSYLNQKRRKQLDKLHQQNLKKIQQKENQLFGSAINQSIKPEQNKIKITDSLTIKPTISIISQSKSNPIQDFRKLTSSLSCTYTDKSFPCNQITLGQLLSPRVSSWRHPLPQQSFIKGSGMSPQDVLQGQIGDCYLISSFAVLGQTYLAKACGKDGDIVLWQNQKGAYMVRFWKWMKQHYVVVDDCLPVDADGKWVFAKSQEQGEFWPGVLEKAYAKLYGGYQNIISGKCHQVLSEFSGGFPFQLLLLDYKSNSNALWSRMVTSIEHGYLLAAGSPQNAMGDAAFSARGIVQGHAYSILGVRQVQQNKIIKLKNPHGSAGREWSGQFSDQSSVMTKKMRILLKHEKKNDGIFWMKLQDFITEFKSLYICCIFDVKWKKLDLIEGRWIKDVNSFGRAQNSNQSHKNLQYGINVTKKCHVFISLSQQFQTALRGKTDISFRVQRNSSLRLHKTQILSDHLCGAPTKPTNLVTISQQIQLQSNSYPYTFTLYIASQLRDKSGADGQFKLIVYCNDLDAQLIRDQDFDLKGKDN